VYVRESEDLMDEAREIVKNALFGNGKNGGRKNWSHTKNTIKHVLRDFIYAKNKRRPMILPIIMEI